MAECVIRTSRDGYNIYDEKRYLTLDSTKNQFKVADSGSGTISFSAGGLGSTAQRNSVDIAHNLGYQPSFYAWLSSSSVDWKQSPVVNSGATGPTKWCSGITRIDDNTIRLYAYIYDPTLAAYSAFDVSYEYIIFVDPNKDVWS